MRTYAAAVATIVLLAGCSSAPSAETPAGTPQPSETTTTSAMTTTPSNDGTILDCPTGLTGPWIADAEDGAVFTITIPGKGALVTDAEALRRELGAPAVTYASVHVNNVGGTEQTQLYSVVPVTADGRQVPSWDYTLDGWYRLSMEKDSTLSQKVLRFTEKLGSHVVPGAKGERLLVIPEPNITPQRLHVYVNTFQRMEACRT